MIAIGTNVLLRYLLQDDDKQSPKANKLIAGIQKILITDVVLTETIWTLKGKKYNLSKDNLLSVIDALFKETNIDFEDGQTVWRALHNYRTAPPKIKVDFADALILEKSQYHAKSKSESFGGLYTFDAALQQLENTKKP